jgi:hypothetical protein
MMGWTGIADNFDAFSAAVINEYVGALNERRQAVGLAPIATYAEDDLVPNSAAIIRSWQQWVETYLPVFAVSHDAGVPRAGGYYDGAATIDTYADLAAVFSAAGLAHANWRRIRDHAFFAFGQAQEDDDYALELFEDIQKCLNVLVWVMQGTLPFSGDEYKGEGVDPAWLTAKGLAESDYKLVGTFETPFAQSYGGGGSYVAGLIRTTGNVQATVWNGLTRYADWYVFAVLGLAVDTFDAYGDDVIQDKWSLWSKDEPATNANVIISGTVLGQTAMPNNPWCAAPVGGNSVRGWEAGGDVGTGLVVVTRWNVPGGFVYV